MPIPSLQQMCTTKIAEEIGPYEIIDPDCKVPDPIRRIILNTSWFVSYAAMKWYTVFHFSTMAPIEKIFHVSIYIFRTKKNQKFEMYAYSEDEDFILKTAKKSRKYHIKSNKCSFISIFKRLLCKNRFDNTYQWQLIDNASILWIPPMHSSFLALGYYGQFNNQEDLIRKITRGLDILKESDYKVKLIARRLDDYLSLGLQKSQQCLSHWEHPRNGSLS